MSGRAHLQRRGEPRDELLADEVEVEAHVPEAADADAVVAVPFREVAALALARELDTIRRCRARERDGDEEDPHGCCVVNSDAVRRASSLGVDGVD